MSTEVDNLAGIVENLSISSIFNTNWNDLKPKLKLRCIEEMGLKERLLLRSTSKTEKALVESRKIPLYFAELSFNPHYYYGTYLCFRNSEYETSSSFKLLKQENGTVGDYKKTIPHIELLLKLVSFDELVIDSPRKIDFTDLFGDFTDSFSVNSFKIKKCSEKDLFYWSNNLNSDIKKITFDADEEEDFPFEKLLEIPKVINSPLWQIMDLYRSDSAHRVAKIWIDADVEIGKTFQVQAMKDGTMKEFLENFKDRIIEYPDKYASEQAIARIRTNNPEKHIVLELGLDESEHYDNVDALQFFRLHVIPADMKDSEYDWKTNKWMNVLNPGYYFPGEHTGFTSSSDDYFSD